MFTVEATAAPATLADLIRQFRSDARLSQEDVAERAGVSTRTVSDIECGVAKSPRAITLSLLAEALGLDEAARDRLRAATRRPGSALPPLERPGGERQNLPLAVTSFVGRERELAEIAALFERHRVVTIAGPGGIGKTRASLAVAAALLPRYADGIWFVGLAPLSDGALIPGAIAASLGMVLAEGGDALAALVAGIGTKRLLIVLDNCEHVAAAAAAVVAAVQRGCAQAAVLTSSRQKLGIEGEAIYRIGPLALPSAADSEGLSATRALAYEAIALFEARARAVDRRFALADADAPVVARICRALDGIPLAIELAAGRVDVLAPRQLAELLDRRFAILNARARDVEPRRQTLRALIDWSYELLDEREGTLFRALGIFVDGFTLEAAEGVASRAGLDAGEVFDLLASLVDKSLVVAEIDEQRTRFRLLETTRAYAAIRIDESGERERLAAAHLAYFRDCAERTEQAFLQSGSDAAFMTSLAFELQDLRAALAWALGGGDVLAGASLAAAIGHPWSRLGHSEEGIARLDAFAAALPASEALLLARVYCALAWLAVNTFRGTRAADAAKRALACARRAGDAPTLALALGYAAIAAARLGNLADAAAWLDDAEALVPAPNLGQTLRHVEVRGFIAHQRGDLAIAAEAYERHRALRRRLGDEFGEANAALTLAEIEHASGQTERAIALMRDVLPGAARLLGREQHANALSNLAGYLLAAGKATEAAVAARDALALLSDGDPGAPLAAFALEHAALAIGLDGDWERAALLAAFCERAVDELGTRREHTERLTRERLAAELDRRFDAAGRAAFARDAAALAPRDAVAAALLQEPTHSTTAKM